jgi:hypothetical protein
MHSFKKTVSDYLSLKNLLILSFFIVKKLSKAVDTIPLTRVFIKESCQVLSGSKMSTFMRNNIIENAKKNKAR